MPKEGKPLEVAVLGAAGTIAPAIVHDLGRSEEVARLLLLDVDRERAAAAVEHGAGKARAEAVDARAVDELAARLRGCDVLVNSASYRINLEAMQACLTACCHYLDLGGLYYTTRRQLGLSHEFEQAGLLGLLGIGSAPGKTNVMARHGVELLGPGAQIDSIEVCAAGRDPVVATDGRLRPPYALQTLIDELTLAPVLLRDGRPVEVAPMTDGGEVDYGDPIGPGRTIYTLHSELATFGDSFGCRAASFRLSLAPALLSRLEELTGASAASIAAAAAQAAPASAQTVSVHLVTVRADDGETVRVRARTAPHFGLGGGVVSTAAPIAAAVRLLARGAITARGVMAAERCIAPSELFAELEARGCSFSVSRD
jgi:saccharopine dehydrogenase (NAD+, L-lysine-forming)